MTWNQGNDEDRESGGEQPTPSWTTDGWQQSGENRTDSGAHNGTDFQGQQPIFGAPQPDFGAPQEQHEQPNAGWQPATPPAPEQSNSGWQAPDQQQWQGQQPDFGGPQRPAASDANWQQPAAPQEPQWNGGYSNFNAAEESDGAGQPADPQGEAPRTANEGLTEQPGGDAPKAAWGNWAGPEEPSIQHDPVQAPLGDDTQSVAAEDPHASEGAETTAPESDVPGQETQGWDAYGPPTEMLDTSDVNQTTNADQSASQDDVPVETERPTSAFGAWPEHNAREAQGSEPQSSESEPTSESHSAFGTWPNTGGASTPESNRQEQPSEAFGDSAFSAPGQSSQPTSDENQSSGWGTAAGVASGAAAAGAGAWAATNQPWQPNGDASQEAHQWGQPQDASQNANPQNASQWGQNQDAPLDANQWGQNPDAPQGHGQWGQDQNFGHSTPPQSWQEASQGEAQTQAFGAPPAAFPGDQNVPFQNAQPIPAPGGSGGPGGEGPGGPGGFGPGNASEDKKAPWYKKKSYLIIGIVLVAVIIIAAIAIPLVIHQRNVDRGDNLAATFNNALEEYNSNWNEENLAAVSAVNLTDPISAANRTWYDLNTENREALDQACADIQPALDKRTELADTTVPELPQEDAAEASEAYKQAQQDAETVATQRTSAEDFLTGSETSLSDMSEFCANYGAYADLYDTYEENLAGVLADAYSVPEGDRIETSDGAVYYLCESSDGCANLYNPDTREQFAAAMETTYVGYYQGLADLYSTQCFMTAFADACAVGATDYQLAADAYQAIVDHLRGTEPTVAVGKTLYPELDTLGPKASDAEVAADTNFLAEWQKVEPSAYSMNTTGTSLGTLFADKVSSIQELATTALGS